MKTDLVNKIETAAKENPEHLGVHVGLLCIRGKVPLAFVQIIVDTTLVSVYRWVSGRSKPQNKADIRKLKRLVYTLTNAIESGVLPAQARFDPDLLLPLWKKSKDAV